MLEESLKGSRALRQCLAGSGGHRSVANNSHIAFVQYVLTNGMLISLAFWHMLDMYDTAGHVQLGPGSSATGSSSSNPMGYSGARCQCMRM